MPSVPDRIKLRNKQGKLLRMSILEVVVPPQHCIQSAVTIQMSLLLLLEKFDFVLNRPDGIPHSYPARSFKLLYVGCMPVHDELHLA